MTTDRAALRIALERMEAAEGQKATYAWLRHTLNAIATAEERRAAARLNDVPKLGALLQLEVTAAIGRLLNDGQEE